MNTEQVAVAMSVYNGDNSDYLICALDSLFKQEGVDSHVFLQIDGPVSDLTKEIILKYQSVYCLYPTWHPVNAGLATRLNDAIKLICESKSDYKYIARMDSDDICRVDRFKKQVLFLNTNLEVDVVGSDVVEINADEQVIFYKRMDSDHDAMVDKIIKKCPFNHPSVMFRISIFKEGVRYKDWLKNTQDYYLWIDLLAAGKRFSNINEPLLSFRVDDNFHYRRGWKKAMNDFNSRLYAFNRLNVVSLDNIIHVIMLFILRLSPAFVKKMVYKYCR